MTSAKTDRIRVLRVYHSGVVSAWRERDRELTSLGADVTLVSPVRWNEGGALVAFERGNDGPIEVARTIGRHPYRFLYDPIRLWRALRRSDYDIIDVHEEPASLAAAEVQLVAWLAGRRGPFCLYSAQNIEKRYPPPFRWLERIALRRAVAVHTCNDEVEGVLRRKGYRGRVLNLGLGVDVERFTRRPTTSDAPTLRVGYVGRVAAHKGVTVLVSAMKQLPGFSLEIVGDGAQRAEVERQIADLGIASQVHVSGFVADDELPDVYRRFDVVVVPSLETPGWVEQFGRVALEAMATGLPVVASKTGALPELLGDAGVLVPPDDPDALAAALRRLAQDPEERARLGGLARLRAEHFSWPSIARRQLDFYRQMSHGR